MLLVCPGDVHPLFPPSCELQREFMFQIVGCFGTLSFFFESLSLLLPMAVADTLASSSIIVIMISMVCRAHSSVKVILDVMLPIRA